MGNLEVQQWFDNGKVYADGVKLYETIGKNKLLLRNFKRVQSISMEKKLEYELSKFLPIPEKVVVVKDLMKQPVINFEQVIEVKVEELKVKQQELLKRLPAELRPTLLRANLKWKENCILKLQLNSLPDDAEDAALKIQLQIDENQKENALCWKQVDYWLDHKQLPKEAKSDFDGLTPAELVKRQQYHFAAISKLKKRIEKNKELLPTLTIVSKIAKTARELAKQESNLLAKEQELEILTNLVNGKET